ncbi:MAG: gamma-glutamylcyclotransferase family protein [Longimicrobiales bacterium]|nr:gamma-glutamylcyclotransferase family protein [Longimicrobiales bacterium]
MKRPYFAYGSNLCVPRLRHRVLGVRPAGVARLPGWELRWHKRGADGSGKCSIVPTPAKGVVHGGVFHVPHVERALLDGVEGLGRGYAERILRIDIEGKTAEAWTYVAQDGWIDPGLRPFGWYRELVLAGAHDLGLPPAYLRDIASVSARRDPDRARAARNLRFLDARRRPRG